MGYLYYKAINWDQLEDQLDKYTWEMLTTNFWLDTRIPVAKDEMQWNHINKSERDIINKMFAGSSLNAVLQSEVGTPSLRHNLRTQEEEAIINIITFMKSVHAKGYSTIFRDLITKEQTAKYFNWANNEETLQKIADKLYITFDHGTPLQKKAAFILTETALSFGKFAESVKHSELIHTNHMLFNMIRGDSIFISYLGYKFRLSFEELDKPQQKTFITWLNDFIYDTTTLEIEFLNNYLDDSTEALNFMNFGLNEALDSLGMEYKFPIQNTNALKRIKPLMTDRVTFMNSVNENQNDTDTEKMTDDDYDF